jgi:ABC-type antimicrobial peptide transport system permease subunit
MVLKQGLALAGSGIAIGVVLWVLASKPIVAFLEAHSFSWGLLALVAAGLLAAAAVGAYIPARRASLIDPNLVLRQD